MVYAAIDFKKIPTTRFRNVLWTEFVSNLMDIDEGPNGITFRSEQISHNAYRWCTWRSRQAFAVVIVSTAYQHYTENNMVVFDKLIRSLSTIFFRRQTIVDIAQVRGIDMHFRSIVFAKLWSLRTDWKRISMYDMFSRCHCSYAGTICIWFFVICGFIFGFVSTLAVAYFFCCATIEPNFSTVKQDIVSLFPDRRKLKVVVVVVVLFALCQSLWIPLFIYPLFAVPL
eukprot:878104_1